MSAAPVAAKQATTTIRFTVSEKGRNKLPGGQLLVTRASGSGTLTLADTPQANAVNKSTGATGTIRFHGWRVVGNRVIDDANLSMDVVSGTYRFHQPHPECASPDHGDQVGSEREIQMPRGIGRRGGAPAWEGKEPA